MRVCIVGAGATGLAAAWELRKQGHDVALLEASDRVGGLSASFEIGGEPIEEFYHHIFTGDGAILALVAELGMNDALKWYEPRNAFRTAERLYPFTTPFDLLRFSAVSLRSRIALGFLVLKARRIRDWAPLEEITAREWILRTAGNEVWEKVWGPLVQSKFDDHADRICAAWLWKKLHLRGASRSDGMKSELLGYMDGSFAALFRELGERLEREGAELRLNTPVRSILSAEGGVRVVTETGAEMYDRCVFTAAPEQFLRIAEGLPCEYARMLEQSPYKANVCVVLRLNRRLSPYYWTSVADRKVPFVAVVEHTNLVGAERYGCHIVYLSRYLDAGKELYSADDASVRECFLTVLERLYPSFDRSSVLGCDVFRARYAQPVVPLGRSRTLPPSRTPLQGVLLASMAQIYPEDRGLNYAVAMGKEVAGLL